ncbi:hypothetical protein SAJA_08340 [Salinisphaera japonica YTM-1]|uniref:Uncharacterized protein n=1 Tax=Salinisphaera japonica YTM-1 TaxID=1209778 RepID=A0A423PRA1_9GAMM|nr:hypothetical protein SAJA_08340 [Salinisphaera japonica YTM-1]
MIFYLLNFFIYIFHTGSVEFRFLIIKPTHAREQMDMVCAKLSVLLAFPVCKRWSLSRGNISTTLSIKMDSA